MTVTVHKHADNPKTRIIVEVSVSSDSNIWSDNETIQDASEPVKFIAPAKSNGVYRYFTYCVTMVAYAPNDKSSVSGLDFHLICSGK